jgi:hypothetical protein
MNMSQRSGFALFTALVTMTVIGALISASALAIDERGRSTRASTMHLQALASAEGGVWNTFVAANPLAIRSAPLGVISRSSSTSGGLSRSVTVTKIDTAVVWIVAEARIVRGREKIIRRIGIVSLLPADTLYAHLVKLPGSAWVDLYGNP